MIFLDTNIVIYAQGVPHLFKGRCQRFLAKVAQGKKTIAINTEVLQEIIYFYQKRKKLSVGIETYEALITLADIVCPVTQTVTDFALELLKERPHINYRDAIHLATMQEVSIKEICSFDKHFDGWEHIMRHEPA